MKKRQYGMSVLSSILGVLIVGAVAVGAAQFKKSYDASSLARERGNQYVTLLKAGEAYAKKNQTKILQKDLSVTMQPSIADLKAGGFLADKFTDNLPARLGGDLRVRLEYEPVGCPSNNCVIAVKVIPTSSILRVDNQPDKVLAAEIALNAGGFGWSSAQDTNALLAKNQQRIINPLGVIPAVAIAATWLPSNKPGSTDTRQDFQSLPCPAPQVGVIINVRNIWTDKNGNTASSPWVLQSSSCSMPPPTCSNGALDYPTCTPPVTPTCSNGATDYPTCTPPSTPTCSNGATDYPTCTPPSTPTCSNGASDYPVCTPPRCANGASDYPICTPPSTPTCSNGATDYPTCTPPSTPTCSNGATDYPTCTPPSTPTCSNGATNYPTCTPPTCSNGGTNYPICTPPTCSNGATDYPTCTPPVCANGAKDYPTCTPPIIVTPTSCTQEIFYFNGVDKNNPTYTTITLAVGQTSGGYCSGYTRNWATRYQCQASGSMIGIGVIQMGCGLYN